MNFVHSMRRSFVVLAAVAMIAFPGFSFAQEISESHLKAARAAVDAINSTDVFDNILPAAAGALKRELIQKNPDLTAQITQIVDEKTLEMTARRTDLEKEAALAYARMLSEDDLNAIAAFYNSPAGINLLTNGPIVTREVAKAAEIWQNGVARDLAEVVGKELEARAPAAQAAQPAAPAAPAAETPTAQPPAN